MLVNNSNNPILITGVQRSGATIVARIINMSGAYTGICSEMMENDCLKNMVTSYYKTIKADTKAQYPLPNTKSLLIPNNWKKMTEIRLDMETVKIKENQPWVFKSSTNCQIWPVWHYAYPNAKWVIVRRRTGDIITSCMKTAYMMAFKDPSLLKTIGVRTPQDGWLWWVHEHEKLFVEMIEAGLNCKVIWPDRMVTGDYTQIKEMLEWLGLQWSDSIVNVIDPLLNKSKKKGVLL
jgi:hypothetical protein